MMKTTATKKAPAAGKPKAASKPATAKAGTGKGKVAGQTQTGADLGKQGEGTAGKTPAAVVAAPTALAPKATAPIVGGTKKVLIEVVPVSKKPYTPRAMKPELYPFGELTPAVKRADGEIEGPSFFIPDADDAEQKIQTARKRHKGVLFWARSRREKVNGKGPVVAGKRVWRGTEGVTPPK